MDGPELIKTAHKSLGYLPGPLILSGSPESDSVRALWRTASDHALDVIPDTLSPVKPSGERMMRQRMRSAPDLWEIYKTSPPTPRSSGVHAFRQSSPRSRNAVKDVGERMREAARAVDPAVLEIRHELESARCLGDALLTPRSSPVKRLGSPLFTPSPDKRVRRKTTYACTHQIDTKSPARLRSVLPVLPTPPPTSPVLQPLSGNIDVADQSEVRDSEEGPPRDATGCKRSKGDVSTAYETCIPRAKSCKAEAKGRRGKLDKALSLRSRIRLVLRSLAT